MTSAPVAGVNGTTMVTARDGYGAWALQIDAAANAANATSARSIFMSLIIAPMNERLVVNDPDRLDFRVHRAAMVDPEVLEREMRRIFDVCWIYAGHESEVRAPGDFITRSLCGRPVILSRDSDNRVRVFLNV